MSSPAAGIRLSFLTQVDQARYETLFTQASTDNVTLSASAAKNVLTRSNLGDDALATIWDLSNVTHNAQLTFPEFALAMYLTSMKMTGRVIPTTLPDNIRNEIYSAIQTLQSKPTLQQSQPTGMQQPQPTGMQQPQPTGMQQPQPTGMYSSTASLAPSPQPQRSASTSMLNNLAGGISPSYMQQQPGNLQIPAVTGMPNGVSSYQQQVPMPTGMYGHNMAFANQMMPNADYSRNQQHHYQRLAGKVKIPWAVTTEEKQQYSKIFKAWDSDKVGYLTGEKAKEIFTQSGLAQNVLMQIWNLSDPNNQGKLNVDEFSVAMHLIYRKLNGYDVPTSLPPELIPPSTRELKDTVDSLKDSILKSIAQKKSVTSFNDHSFSSLSVPSGNHRSRSVSPGPTQRRSTKKTDVVDDDKDVGYVSSARRMGPDRSRWNSKSGDLSPTSSPKTSSYEYRGKATRIAELRKQIGDCKATLKKIDDDSKQKIPKTYNELTYLEQNDIDEIKTKVKELQQEITRSGASGDKSTWEVYIDKTTELSSLADQEKSLTSEVRFMIDDTLHGLLKQVDETEDDLKAKKIQKAKLDQAKTQGEPVVVPDTIQGTGPNGEVTEADRIRAKAKALIAAKMGKLTGQTNNNNGGPSAAEAIRLAEEERMEFQLYSNSIRDTIRDLEDAVKEIGMGTSLIGLDIRKHEQDQKIIDERNRFEYGYKVAPDLKEFVDLLAFETAAALAPDVDPSFESRFPDFNP